MDSRAVTAVLEKTVAVGLVVLFVSGLGGALLGGAVPSYRASAAGEVGDRALAAAADRIEDAVPSTGAAATVRRHVTVPATLAGETYRLELDGRALRLDHPDRAVAGTARLALPSSVTVRNTTVGAGTVVVSVTGAGDNRTVTLEAR